MEEADDLLLAVDRTDDRERLHADLRRSSTIRRRPSASVTRGTQPVARDSAGRVRDHVRNFIAARLAGAAHGLVHARGRADRRNHFGDRMRASAAHVEERQRSVEFLHCAQGGDRVGHVEEVAARREIHDDDFAATRVQRLLDDARDQECPLCRGRIR